MRSPIAPARRRVSFLVHEVIEYGFALLLFATGLHASGRTEDEFLATGGALVLLGLLSSGPLGAKPLLERRAHRIADLVVAVGLALSPLIAIRGSGPTSIALAEGFAGLWIVITRATRYLDVPREKRQISSTRAADAAAHHLEMVGELASVVGPVASRSARAGARRLGRVAGVTRRIAREQRASGNRSGS